VYGGTDIFRLESLQDRVPIGTQLLEPQEDGKDVPRVPHVRTHRRHRDLRHRGEHLCVTLRDGRPPLEELFEPPQLGEPEGALHIREPIVVTQVHHPRMCLAAGCTLPEVRFQAVVPEPPQPRREPVVVRGNHSTLASGNEFRRMEAEDGEIRD
jgi:hypothetical protein